MAWATRALTPKRSRRVSSRYRISSLPGSSPSSGCATVTLTGVPASRWHRSRWCARSSICCSGLAFSPRWIRATKALTGGSACRARGGGVSSTRYRSGGPSGTAWKSSLSGAAAGVSVIGLPTFTARLRRSLRTAWDPDGFGTRVAPYLYIARNARTGQGRAADVAARLGWIKFQFDRLFNKATNTICPAAFRAFCAVLGVTGHDWIWSPDIFWDRITSITPAGEQEVYGLQVEPPARSGACPRCPGTRTRAARCFFRGRPGPFSGWFRRRPAVR